MATKNKFHRNEKYLSERAVKNAVSDCFRAAFCEDHRKPRVFEEALILERGWPAASPVTAFQLKNTQHSYAWISKYNQKLLIYSIPVARQKSSDDSFRGTSVHAGFFITTSKKVNDFQTLQKYRVTAKLRATNY